MKKIREHLLYSIVIGVGFILFIATIGLQFAILSQQGMNPTTGAGPATMPSAEASDSFISQAANQLTEMIQARTRRAAQEETVTLGARSGNSSGNNSSGSNSNSAQTRPAPMTVTSQSVDPTKAAVIQVERASPTLLPQPSPTFISPPTDLRIGTVDRGLHCAFYSEVVATILTQAYGLSVEIIPFKTADALYAALTTQSKQPPATGVTFEVPSIDLTLCFIDPTDRVYMQRYVGYINVIGRAYWQNPTHKLQIMANTSIITPLKTMSNQPDACLYTFLQSLAISESHTQPQDVSAWIEANKAQVGIWTNCKQ